MDIVYPLVRNQSINIPLMLINSLSLSLSLSPICVSYLISFTNCMYVVCLLSAGRLCWFLQHEDIKSYMEQNYDSLLSTLLNVYRATEVIFSGENELEEARSFSRTLLERGLNIKNANDGVVKFNIQREVTYHAIEELLGSFPFSS